MRQNPYLFIVGCPRSGTTLLQRMLDHHPMLAVASDTHFIPKVFEGIDEVGDLPLTSNLVEQVRSYHRFFRLGLSDEAVAKSAQSSRTYGAFVSGLYLEYARMKNKALAGEKTPDYVKSLPLLHKLFPWVKTIHLIRDGRDVTLSALQWARKRNKGPAKRELWAKEPVAVCALWWRRYVMAGQVDGKNLGPDRYHELKYEDLVNRTKPALCDVTQFLELTFAQEMLSYYQGKARYEAGLSAKKAWLSPTPGLRDWRTQMAERDLELFEALAGELLSVLGYERAFRAISPTIARVATECRRSWETEMAIRAKALICATVTRAAELKAGSYLRKEFGRNAEQ